ncbi:MAG: SDR family NAD(P)-dependent oxidoreductase, partial [Aristaeellaceae bacterium]
MSLEGRVALVTGGSRGIGRAVCLALARGGAAVALCYAGNEAAARETEEACRALGAETLALRCDVTDEAAVKDLVAAVVKRFGRLDILVNNAG